MASRIFLIVVFLQFVSSTESVAQTETAAQTETVRERIAGDSQSLQEAVDGAATAGGLEQQSNARIRRMNRTMREYYSRTLADRAARLDPVIVVQFDGEGGTFNLRDGKRRVTIQPVPETYELAKDVAHAPLGIFVILSPWLATPHATGWQADLKKFGQSINDSLEHLDESGLPGEAREHARRVLTESVNFVDVALDAGGFTLDEYRAYAARIFPSIVALRYFATDVQVRSIVALLEQWRDEMGPERWRELSAAVISPHTLSVETPSFQCLRFVMDSERVEDRLIHVGGDYGKDVDKAISVLARLYTDRLAARLAFQGEPHRVREMAGAMSSKRDLMADPAASVLRTLAQERKKP